jgi:peroxiredoxin
MYKAILFLLLALFISSCSKDKPPVQNTQNTNAGIFYPVNKIGEQQAKGYYYDFTWSENGKEIKLSDYKGKVIMLNFWATWCAPCRQEMPGLSQLAMDLSSKDFVLIGISLDQSLRDLDSYIKTYPIAYPILHDDGNLINKYTWVTGSGSVGIPQTFIIDRNGKVVEMIVGARSKDDMLKLINKYL